MVQSRDFQCCWAGSEIPRWFIHQSEGSSICINLPPCLDQWYNRTYLGLAICVVLEKENYYSNCYDIFWNSISYECLYTSPNGDSLSLKGFVSGHNMYDDSSYNFCQDCSIEDFWVALNETAMGMNCEHVVLYYDSTYGEVLYKKNGRYGANENGFTGTTGTTIATASFFFKPSKDTVKVKKCGVHLLYTQDAEKFGFVEPHNWEE